MADNNANYSKYYSTETAKHKDKPRFRARLLKFIEDFVNSSYAAETYRLCRSELGIDIERVIDTASRIQRYRYHIENTFNHADLSIEDILDFLTVVYDSSKPGLENNNNNKLLNYIETVNKIFREESMCYIFTENGRVRYYPDEESHKTISSTLAVLGKPKYDSQLNLFNEVLDDYYRNYDKESPIRGIFDCIESFVLSLLSDRSYKKLDKLSVDKFINTIMNYVEKDSSYTEDDKKAIENFNELLLKWVSMCHKYRHGKQDQSNKNVPKELFNFIFSNGITIFRFFLELNDKYQVKQ
jgi:hypothetical protein